VVRGQAETRQVYETLVNSDQANPVPSTYINFNSQITGNDWYRALPLVAKGDEQHQRQGDQITPTSLKLTWDFSFTPTNILLLPDVSSRDITVVLLMAHSKSGKVYRSAGASQTGAAPDASTGYLKGDQGANTYFDGNQLRSTFSWNKAAWTPILTKKFRLHKPAGVANATQATSYNYGQSQIVRRQFTHTIKKLPKLKYDSTQNGVPQNYAPYWAVGYYYNDGSKPDTSGGILQVSCRTYMSWKDE